MKRVLLVTDGFFHPPLWGRLVLHAVLRKMPGYAFQHVRSLENFPADFRDFSAMVLHYHHKTISAAALERLDQYVKNGGGVLAIHGATASFKETLPYFEILGGRFIGHGKLEPFEVIPQDSAIFAGIGNFRLRDELYIHELLDDLQVHFIVKHENQDIPLVWTRQHGTGRVCYAVPGHTVESMRNRSYQTLLRRGLEWVSHG